MEFLGAQHRRDHLSSGFGVPGQTGTAATRVRLLSDESGHFCASAPLLRRIELLHRIVQPLQRLPVLAEVTAALRILRLRQGRLDVLERGGLGRRQPHRLTGGIAPAGGETTCGALTVRTGRRLGGRWRLRRYRRACGSAVVGAMIGGGGPRTRAETTRSGRHRRARAVPHPVPVEHGHADQATRVGRCRIARASETRKPVPRRAIRRWRPEGSTGCPSGSGSGCRVRSHRGPVSRRCRY